MYELTCHIISNTPLSVRCRLSTLQRVTFVIRLPWHFVDGGWKMSETKGWLNGFHLLLRVWCIVIDRLIPWRNRMCQGRRLMEHTETCIPLGTLSESKLARLWTAALPISNWLSLSFALHHLPPLVWVERSNPQQICLYVFKDAALLSTPDHMWERKISHFCWREMYRGAACRARMTMTHDNGNSFGAQTPGEIGSAVTIQQYK